MSKQPGRCCGTDNTWFGPMKVEWRGMPKVKKAGRRVYHVDGEKRWWHWYDQRRKMAAGYGVTV